jgi:aspartate aminotransferase
METKVSTFKPSQTVSELRSISFRLRGQRAGRVEIPLSMGEPDYPTPSPVVDAAIDALRGGWTHYGDLDGDPELRSQISAITADISGRPVDTSQVVITHGGSGAIAATVLAMVDPGDRVVIPEPTYSLYADAVALAGGIPVLIGPDDTTGRLDIARIAIEARRARLIMFCNPVNPTGVVFDAAELAALGESLSATETFVMADEAYSGLVYDGRAFTSAVSVDSLADRLIHVQTLSKSFAMTGWRLGYVVAPTEIATAVRDAHLTINNTVNSAVQRAGLVALRMGDQLVAPMRETYQRRRDLVVDLCAVSEHLSCFRPEGTFYAFLHYSAAIPAVELCRLLADAGVAVRPGSEYGPSGEHHVRISFATDEARLEDGMRRIEGVLAKLPS